MPEKLLSKRLYYTGTSFFPVAFKDFFKVRVNVLIKEKYIVSWLAATFLNFFLLIPLDK
jgi:hypothetical protein